MRKVFIVEVDLDPIAGDMSTIDRAREALQQILDDRISHYNPSVTVASNEMQWFDAEGTTA